MRFKEMLSEIKDATDKESIDGAHEKDGTANTKKVKNSNKSTTDEKGPKVKVIDKTDKESIDGGH